MTPISHICKIILDDQRCVFMRCNQTIATDSKAFWEHLTIIVFTTFIHHHLKSVTEV